MNLLRTEYSIEEQSKPVLYLFTRDNGKRTVEKVQDFQPYFWIPESEKDKTNLRTGRIAEAINGTTVREVFTAIPADVPKWREKYSQTWEADILFSTRFQIDRIDSLDKTEIKTAFLDLEMDNTGRIPNVEVVDQPIICASIYDTLSEIYYTFVWRHDLVSGKTDRIFDGRLHEIYYYKTEKDMLETLVQFIRDEGFDVLSGWNSNPYDLPYLVNRITRLGLNRNKLSPMNKVYLREDKGHLEPVIMGIACLDLLSAYRKFARQLEESYTLNYIASKVIGRGKTETGSNIPWLWRNDLDKLIEYNTNDVSICAGIDSKLRLLEFLDELRRLAFCQLEDTLYTNRTLDSYILRLFKGRKVFPTRSMQERIEYEGAFVGSWGEGIYENIVVFDLISLYPNLVCEFNISPDTIYSNNSKYIYSNNSKYIYSNNSKSVSSITVNGLAIRREPKGFLPEVIENLFIERRKYKKLMNDEKIGSDSWNLYYSRQYALKVLLNGLYGQCAYPNSRLYCPPVAESITYLGRELITWSKQFLENLGYKVLACDTDSLFWEFGREIDFEVIEDVRRRLNESYSEFVRRYKK